MAWAVGDTLNQLTPVVMSSKVGTGGFQRFVHHLLGFNPKMKFLSSE
jgi:hypothetical protein